MAELFNTILPIALFWMIEAVYLGGWPVDAHGGSGAKQVMGLLVTFVLWVVVWQALNRVFAGIGPVLGGIVITSFVTSALTPWINVIGFKLWGVSIRKVAASH